MKQRGRKPSPYLPLYRFGSCEVVTRIADGAVLRFRLARENKKSVDIDALDVCVRKADIKHLRRVLRGPLSILKVKP